MTVVPWTTITMPTCSQGQQQLRTAARQLPELDPYGYGHSSTLLHPQVTALRQEYQPDDIASSSGELDDTTSTSPFSPLMQIWTYTRCDQAPTGG